MLKKYKYDVAISVAEEDLPVAQRIADYLKVNRISYYLYTEHAAKHWGDNLMSISYQKYSSESKYVLILLSEQYLQKRWAGIEQQFAEAISANGMNNILPLQLDETPIERLGKNIVFMRWNNNPEEITRSIEEKLLIIERRLRNRIIRNSLFFLFLLAVVIYSVFLVNYRVNKRLKKLEDRGKEHLADTGAQNHKHWDTVQAKAVSINSDSIDSPKPDVGGNVPGTTIANDTISGKIFSYRPDSAYFIQIEGTDAVLHGYLQNELMTMVAAKGFAVVADSSLAGRKIHIDYTLPVVVSEDMQADGENICNYEFSVTNASGKILYSSNGQLGYQVFDNQPDYKSIVQYFDLQFKKIFN